MRLPISWMREYVALEGDVTPERVHEALVSVGFEEEDVHGGTVTGPVVIGEVLEKTPEPQSNGKTINWTSVRVAQPGQAAADGGADIRGIVCGAQNFEVGDRVVVTLPGAVLPGDFQIAARKTYGHISDGMMASARELGLGDEHNGILVLSDLAIDAEVGADALPLLGLDDTAVEINVTPDRGYALSIRGAARELAIAEKASYTDPISAIPAEYTTVADGSFAVRIEDESPIRGQVGSTAFAVKIVEGVDPDAPTPTWMQSRLRLAGVRSISLIVDITNYVMLELGQPIHAYDYDRVAGGITVRRARAGETLTTLDDTVRTLDAQDLVIADESGPIGLAGVMGGASTEVSAQTTTVLIESAWFAGVSIARTARRHKLWSEASKRFERGVDHTIQNAAAGRVAQLLVELAGGSLTTRGALIADERPATTIDFVPDAPTKLLGIDFGGSEVMDALTAIGADVTVSESVTTTSAKHASVTVTVPPWRPDLTESVDLVEEVARISGLDRLPSLIATGGVGIGLSLGQRIRRSVADTLAARGAVEVLSFPFVTEASAAAFVGLGAADAQVDEAGAPRTVTLTDAIDAKAATLRTAGLDTLIDTARRNLGRGRTSAAIFEIGRSFEPESAVGTDTVPEARRRPTESQLAELDAGIPAQPVRVSFVAYGLRRDKQPFVAPERYSWVDAIDAVRAVAAASGLELEVEQGSHAVLHPGRTARVYAIDSDGVRTNIGFAGELHPDVAESRGLGQGAVAVAELDLDRIVSRADAGRTVVPIVAYPAATQDLTVLVARDVAAGAVLSTLRKGAGALLERIQLVDDYRDARDPADGAAAPERALTFALQFRAPDRTLTAAEATEAREAAFALAASELGARMRG